MGFYELQEKKLKTLLKTATAAAVLGLLAACGGGGASSVAGDVVEISFSNPSGVLEAGRLITVTASASSKSGKLTKMAWSVSNGGAAGSTPTLVNDNCTSVQAVDSTFGKGASDWSCTLTLQAPKTLAAETTYDLRVSATGEKFSNSATTSIKVKPATIEANPIQVSFAPLAANNHAGELIRVTGTVSSNKSKLTGARWSLIGGGNVNGTVTTESLTPSLQNADCTDRVQSDNVSGVESSLLTCTLQFSVPRKLPATTNYTLALVGTNADGYSLSNSVTVPVQPAKQIDNRIGITLSTPPTTMLGGDVVTLKANVQTTGSLITTDAITSPESWAVVGASVNSYVGSAGDPVNELTVRQIIDMANGNLLPGAKGLSTCVFANNPTGATSSTGTCAIDFQAPVIPADVTYTLAFAIKDDEGNTNFKTMDITVKARADVFGLRADVSAAPGDSFAPGTNVTMTCAGAGAPASTTYQYLWRVKTSGGMLIPLNTANISSGIATFTAPTPADTTSFELECVVSANGQKATTSAPLTIVVP